MTVRRSGSRRRALTVTILSICALALSTTPVMADPDDVSQIEGEIEEQAAELEVIVEEYNGISEKLAETKKEIKELERELAPYEAELNELYDETEGIAIAAYKQQGLGEVTAFLNSSSPEAFTERMTTLNGTATSTAAIVEKINAAKAEFDERLLTLEELRTEQSAAESELKEKKETIEGGIEQLQADRKDAFGPDAGYIPEYVPGDRGVVVSHAMAQRGAPYVWAASGPDSYDCSGLILDAYAQLGIYLPHNAAAQWDRSIHISRDQLQPGDAVFYNGLAHVAMYIGDGYVIHAPTFGDVVKVAGIDEAATPYYGAGRFL